MDAETAGAEFSYHEVCTNSDVAVPKYRRRAFQASSSNNSRL